MSETPSVALTIAGSDSGGGAGIQADLVTFAALGVHGASVITALTAQNTRAVTAVHVPPVDFLQAQLDAVLDDLPVAAVKTGMLATEKVVHAVAEAAAAGRLPNLVVDPVLVSASGARLLDEGAERAYVEALFPQALVVTPNSREATALLGRPVETVDDARAAARDLAELGPRWVVVKGGHQRDPSGEPSAEAVDVVYEAATGAVTELRRPRVATGNDHGTGCTFAAATAARLASGDTVPEALAAAKDFVHEGLTASAGWRLGAGHGPVGKLGAWARRG
ncbi:MAG: bifunctional hydroxymethylpyrimidine kinase/phosphomethylpyrimidine kinase [Thermoanaerobacterales bacterium]|jgi:hydroxymethylpyrimidine/phosphomethylpyrimidine kinase|nr:bifunctional hydroxymethylpyrimidine kinase/phosphomethylpyrimidine kinase [Thermoanaerobacterales bacterium]